MEYFDQGDGNCLCFCDPHAISTRGMAHATMHMSRDLGRCERPSVLGQGYGRHMLWPFCQRPWDDSGSQRFEFQRFAMIEERFGWRPPKRSPDWQNDAVTPPPVAWSSSLPSCPSE